MKKYRLFNLADNEIVGVYSTKAEAISVMNDLVDGINETNGETVENGLSPFDFSLVTVDEDDDDTKLFNEAVKYLLSRTDTDSFHADLEDVETLNGELNGHHVKAIIALNRLFTIAEAWNQKCGFVPDFTDEKQEKWYPSFSYSKKFKCFICHCIMTTSAEASASIGARLCFKTRDIAEIFGKRFIQLYNQAFFLENRE